MCWTRNWRPKWPDRGLSANQNARALISMMARGKCSNQRPDTLMQDRRRQFDEIFLQRTAGPYIGSIASFWAPASHFRSTPVNGHGQSGPAGPFRANNGPWARLSWPGIQRQMTVPAKGRPVSARRLAITPVSCRNAGRDPVKRFHRLDVHETIRPIGRSHFPPPRRPAEINA